MTFKDGEEMAIVQLFVSLQKAHNTMAEVASHLAFPGRTLQPEQFSFILKHSVRPLIQLSVPACLCSPGEIKFAKATLLPKEQFEDKGVNCILPKPHHPKLDSIKSKVPATVLLQWYTICSITNYLKNSVSPRLR